MSEIFLQKNIIDLNIQHNNIFIDDNLFILNHDFFIKQYKEKIKLIYIDPPYNTNSNKTYIDTRNIKDWIEFIKIRLEASRQLLKENGIILVSIDDNQIHNMRAILDVVFGANNFIGTFITMQSQRSNSKLINTVHEYVICYAKNIKMTNAFKTKRINIPEQNKIINEVYSSVKLIIKQEGYVAAERFLKKIIKEKCLQYNITWLKNYSHLSQDKRIFFAKDLSTPSQPKEVNIPQINLKLKALKTRGWSSDAKFIKLHEENRLFFKNNRPYEIHYLEESEDNAPSVLKFYSRHGTNTLKKMGLYGIFDTPKPVEMLKYFIKIMTNNKDDIVLDFFAGSGTTAQAVMELNCEQQSNLKFILIQINEKVNTQQKAYNKCINLKIKPTIDEILLLRLKTFIKNNNLSVPIDIFYNKELT